MCLHFDLLGLEAWILLESVLAAAEPAPSPILSLAKHFVNGE